MIEFNINEIALIGLKYGLIIGSTTMLISKGLSIAWKLLANRNI